MVGRTYTVFIRWAPAEPAGAKPETTPGFQVQVQVHPSLTCWNPARSHLKWNTQTQLPSYCLHTLLSIVYNIHCIDTKLKKRKKELRSEPNNGVGVAWTPFSGRIAYRRFKRTESVQIQWTPVRGGRGRLENDVKRWWQPLRERPRWNGLIVDTPLHKDGEKTGRRTALVSPDNGRTDLGSSLDRELLLRDAQVSGDNAREVTQFVLLDAGLDPRWCVKMDMAPPATGWLLTGKSEFLEAGIVTEFQTMVFQASWKLTGVNVTCWKPKKWQRLIISPWSPINVRSADCWDPWGLPAGRGGRDLLPSQNEETSKAMGWRRWGSAPPEGDLRKKEVLWRSHDRVTTVAPTKGSCDSMTALGRFKKKRTRRKRGKTFYCWDLLGWHWCGRTGDDLMEMTFFFVVLHNLDH